MATFTETETRYIFECLETPYSIQYTTIDGMGSIGSTTYISVDSQGQAKTMILDWIASMDDTSISMVKTTVIPEWIKVRTATAEMRGGSVGTNSITNMSYDPDKQRHRVQTLMQTYIPFFKLHEVLARRAGPSQSTSIPTIW